MPKKGFKHSEETRRKMSEAAKKRFENPEERRKISESNKDEKNHNFGKHLSEECRRKISEIAKKRYEDPEERKKISEGKMGEKHNRWNGGAYGTDHRKSRNLYLKNYCVKCGISRLLNWKIREKDLHMHCVDRNYKNLNPLNWPTLCHLCHSQQHPKKKKE